MAKGSNTRDMNLRIRAEDATAAGVRSAQANLNKVALAQGRIGRENYSAAVASTRKLQVSFKAAAAQAEALETKVRAAGLSASGPLVAQFRQAQRAAETAGRAYGDAAQKMAVTQVQQRGRALGLRPHELQNLGYQVNDLITQIASGTSPMQAFAQQGGQIAQIFPAATSAILRFAPAVAAAAIVVSPLIVALKQMSDEAKRVSLVNDQLAVSGNAARYSKKDLAEYAEALSAIGVKAEDVRGIVSTALREGLRPEYFDRFAQSARGLAKVTGDDLAESINSVTQAFTGNADEVLALDDKLGFLTQSERKHIEALREQKRDVEARTQAFAIFEGRYGAISAKMDGTWARILDNFGEAWGAFGKSMLDGIQWDAIRDELGSILGLIDRVIARLPGVQQTRLETLSAEHRQLDRDIRLNRRARGNMLNEREADAGLAILHRRRDEVNRQIAGIRRTSQTAAATAPDTTFDPPPVANQSTPDRPKRDTEGERLAEKQAEYVANLEAANRQREFELKLIGTAEREAQILSEIERARLQAAEAQTTLTGEQEAAIRSSVGALYDARAEQEAAKTLEQARLDLARERGEVESRAAFIARTTATGMANATAETKAAYAQIMGAAYDIAEAARRQQAAERDTNALVQQRSILLQRLGEASDAGDVAGAIILRDQIVALNAQIVAAATNTLALLQSLSGPEAEAARMGLEELISGAGRLNGEMERVGQTTVLTAADIDQMLVGGGVNALGDFTDALGEGAGVFEAMRDSFLQFAADFLTQIAQMIAQQAILNALGAGAGTSNGSGTGGFLSGMINGLFRHDGGLVGSGGGWRPVNPAVFAGAARYHSGGLAGLRPDEVPAILQRNEEVLTEDDPRHRNNGGLAGRGSVTVRNVNVIDPGDMVAQGLETESGERSFFNFIGRNAGAIKAQMG